MSPDSIPSLSLGSAALVIFALCASFVLLRGITRMIVATVILGLSAWIGFRVWQLAPALSLDWTGISLSWLVSGLPVAAFVISFLALRKLATVISRPFGNPGGNHPPRSLAGTACRLILALVPTSLIWVAGAALVHHAGSVAEVRDHSGNPRSTGLEQLKSSIEVALPATWLAALDPFAEPSRLALAKLIAAEAESPRKPAIDPATGKPIPRAIIVDDPALQTLAREGNFSSILRHPRLTKALQDPSVRKLLGDPHP